MMTLRRMRTVTEAGDRPQRRATPRYGAEEEARAEEAFPPVVVVVVRHSSSAAVAEESS